MKKYLDKIKEKKDTDEKINNLTSQVKELNEKFNLFIDKFNTLKTA